MGPGHFQWNAGGWFGSAIGASMYLVTAAFNLVASRPWLALVSLTAWAGVVGLAIVLWGQRHRRLPYPSYQLLLGALAVAALAVLGILWWRAPEMVAKLETGGVVLLTILVAFPVLFGLFAVLENSALEKDQG